MTKDTFAKMLTGLPADEQKVVLAELGVVDAAAQNELITMAAALVPAANAVQVNAPAVVNNPAPAPAAQPAYVAPAAAVSQPIQQAAALGASSPELQQALQQLATEKAARITAQATAFITTMKTAGKVTPAEEPSVLATYNTLASMADPTALNQYMASMQARPASPMLTETVAASAVVLSNASQAVDTRTEAQKDTDLVASMLNMTPDGQAAAQAMKEGKGDIKGAFNQFAIAVPQG